MVEPISDNFSSLSLPECDVLLKLLGESGLLAKLNHGTLRIKADEFMFKLT